MFKRLLHYRIMWIGLMIATGAIATSASSVTASSNVDLPSSQSYYRHIMFRETPYASYRGIHPIEAAAAPKVAHYQFDYDDKGRIKQIRYQMEQELIRGNEVWDSFIWFAPVVNISYQQGSEIHTYFDANERQIAAHGNVYSAHYKVDQSGKRTGLYFYDQQGLPSQNSWNIHHYEWRHAGGKIYEKRFNLAGEQQPLRPEFQFYEVELEYDPKGQLAFMRNLGLTGTPTNNDSGAGVDRITYDHHGNFVRWQVYDKSGSPVEGNRPMVHLGEHLYDKNGNKVGLRGFDRYGHRIPFSWGVFEHINEYSEAGNQVSHQMKDEAGNMIQHFARQYSQNQSRLEVLKGLNNLGEATHSSMLGGAAIVKYDYQEDGSLSLQKLNPDGSVYVAPTNNQSGE